MIHYNFYSTKLNNFFKVHISEELKQKYPEKFEEFLLHVRHHIPNTASNQSVFSLTNNYFFYNVATYKGKIWFPYHTGMRGHSYEWNSNLQEGDLCFFYYDFSQSKVWFYRGNHPHISTYKDSLKFEINDSIKTQLDKGTGKIILDTSRESISPKKFDFDRFYNTVQRDPKDFILVSGDVRLGTSDDIPTVYDNCWEYQVALNEEIYLKDINQKRELILNKIPAKWYGLNLNRVTKPHRIVMSKFFDEELKDKINYSFGLGNHRGEVSKDIIKDHAIWAAYIQFLDWEASKNTLECNALIDNIEKWLETHGKKNADEDDCDLHVNMANIMEPKTYLNSFFNIITETWTDNETTFLSEKSFKPMLWYQPFITVGQIGTIDFLRKSGYDVFDDIIDHSYDSVPQLCTRIELVKKEIIRLCSISKEDWSQILYDLFPRLHNNYLHLKNSYFRYNEINVPLYKGERINYEPIHSISLRRKYDHLYKKL